MAPFNPDVLKPLDKNKTRILLRRNIVEISKEGPAQMAANKEST